MWGWCYLCSVEWLARIERAEASGKEDKAEELTLQKEMIQPISVPVIAPNINTPKGISYKTKWSAVIIDEDLLDRKYLMPNENLLNSIAQSTKGTLQINGVKFVSEIIMSSRSY